MKSTSPRCPLPERTWEARGTPGGSFVRRVSRNHLAVTSVCSGPPTTGLPPPLPSSGRPVASPGPTGVSPADPFPADAEGTGTGRRCCPRQTPSPPCLDTRRPMGDPDHHSWGSTSARTLPVGHAPPWTAGQGGSHRDGNDRREPRPARGEGPQYLLGAQGPWGVGAGRHSPPPPCTGHRHGARPSQGHLLPTRSGTEIRGQEPWGGAAPSSGAGGAWGVRPGGRGRRWGPHVSRAQAHPASRSR